MLEKKTVPMTNVVPFAKMTPQWSRTFFGSGTKMAPSYEVKP